MNGIVGFHLGGFLGLISCSWAGIGAREVGDSQTLYLTCLGIFLLSDEKIF